MAKTMMSFRLSTRAEAMHVVRGRRESNAMQRRGQHCPADVAESRVPPTPPRFATRLQISMLRSLAAVQAPHRARIAGRVHVTPTMSATRLGDRVGVQLLLKCENLQKTGSFKVRGALNKLQPA